MCPAARLASGAMLREVKNAWLDRRILGYVLMLGETPAALLRRRDVREQAERPVALLRRDDGRAYWAFEGRVYWEDSRLSADDVLALVRDRERRVQRTLERAHAALAANPERRREPIPRAVRLAVFERDGGRCVECGSAFDIQYDHVIPLALGGANTAENLQILCAPCNQAKGATLG
jgi:5-methylcytosine-specific restriction endonuclease McrA